MPGLSGVEAAHQIGRRAHLVFVTAYDQYAVKAFAQGALDYLVKPVEPRAWPRPSRACRSACGRRSRRANTEALLQQLAAQLAQLQAAARRHPCAGSARRSGRPCG